MFQLHPMEVRMKALAAKFACAMVHTAHRYEGWRRVLVAFEACRSPMFLKRSVMRQAFRAVGELGLAWDGVDHLGKEALDAAVRTAARRACGRRGGSERRRLGSCPAWSSWCSCGVMECRRELWEMIQGRRVAGDATEPVLGLVCGVCRVVPSVRVHYLRRKRVAPGMQTAGCDLCRMPGPAVAR